MFVERFSWVYWRACILEVGAFRDMLHRPRCCFDFQVTYAITFVVERYLSGFIRYWP